MRGGLLRNRVTIQRDAGTTPNGFGETAASWVDFAKCVPVSIEPLMGRELWSAQQVQPDVSHRITMRYMPGITAKMRVQYGTRIFHVEGPPLNLNERNRTIQLMCREAT